MFSSNLDGYTLAYHLDGTAVEYFPILNPLALTGSPHMFDVNNDGDIELMVGSMNELIALDIKTAGSIDGYWSTHRANNRRNGYWESSNQPECTVGDVNNTGIIDILDILQTVGIVMGTITPDESQSCAADANSNGVIDILDILLIVNMILVY